MEFPTLINWTNLFLIYWLLVYLSGGQLATIREGFHADILAASWVYMVEFMFVSTCHGNSPG